MQMLDYIIIAMLSVILIVLLISLFAKNKKNLDTSEIVESNKLNLNNFAMEVKFNFEQLLNLVNTNNNAQLELIKIYNQNVIDNIKNLSQMQKGELVNTQVKLSELITSNQTKMDKLIEVLDINLNKMLNSNELKLEQMRVTVDEKLNASLERRLNESFSLISERLEAVSSGLGEMRSLASGVGDLKKVLTNVKTRGGFGEIQLSQLLEQMLAPNQFSSQVQIKPNSLERVDFAINLPGRDDKNLLLPIDAKFPMEDYIKLVDAIECGDQQAILTSKKNLERRIKDEAKKISEKYIEVPTTTDFAIMYLAVEGLYSEILRNSELVEQIQREYKIILTGPTTLSALLNSLQLGFKTLAIEKRSAEIWNLLGTFKKEFTTFVDLLSKTQRKIDEASDSLENATKKSEKINKQLNKISSIDFDGDTGFLN